MQKRNNNYNIPIYQKWPLPLPDIRSKVEIAKIFLLPIFTMNEDTILRSINIIQELAEQLKLLDRFIKNKLILLKENLMTIRNC